MKIKYGRIAALNLEVIAEVIKVDTNETLGQFVDESSLEKEKLHYEKSLQKFAFQGVERYVII